MKNIELIEFGIYTIGPNVFVIAKIEDTPLGDKLYYGQFSQKLFKNSTLTNQCINETLDNFIVNRPEFFHLHVHSKFAYNLDLNNFAYIGIINQDKTKEKLLNAIKNLY